jgi:hypothetical protein
MGYGRNPDSFETFDWDHSKHPNPGHFMQFRGRGDSTQHFVTWMYHPKIYHNR